MTKITFYRQARQDGDIRTGLSINDDVVFDRYDGHKRRNPVLRWFVDVRCEGKQLPTDAEDAREWLLTHDAVIKAGLNEFAEKLQAGIDVVAWPVSFKIKHAPRGIRMNLVCSAVRMVDSREIATILSTVAEHLEEYLKGLLALEAMDAGS